MMMMDEEEQKESSSSFVCQNNLTSTPYLKMKEICRFVAKICLFLYIMLSLFVIGGLVSGKQTFFATAITKTSMRGAENNEEISSTKIEQPKIEQTSAHQKREFPVPEDEYFDRLVDQGSLRSSDHQRKFLARKSRISSEFEARVRFQTQPQQYAAVVISPQFAFLHIWKNGGTTIVDLVGGKQSYLSEEWIQNRQWVAFVRDPIDRFLSAWAECGFRQYEGEISLGGFESHSTLNWLDEEYDFRARAFLHEVIDFTFPDLTVSCHMHAHPQVNYMIDENGHIDHHVKLVGDLHEMGAVLEIAGFHNYTDSVKGRDSSANAVKAEYFPSRRDLLQDQTILELCEFLALDYFLFDFEPPEICVQDGGPLARFV